MRRTAVAAACLVAVVAVSATSFALVRHARSTVGRRETATTGSYPALSSKAFRISGHVRGLYPGRRVRMRVRVRNLTRSPILVTRVGARVRSVPHRCSRRNLVIRVYRGRLRVRPLAHRFVRLRVRMRMAAPNGCQGVRLPLRFWGRAVRP